jgi:hypothetical protein
VPVSSFDCLLCLADSPLIAFPITAVICLPEPSSKGYSSPTSSHHSSGRPPSPSEAERFLVHSSLRLTCVSSPQISPISTTADWQLLQVSAFSLGSSPPFPSICQPALRDQSFAYPGGLRYPQQTCRYIS